MGAASQLTGYPGNAASISMLDWTTGQADAFWWVIKLFFDSLGSGLKTVAKLQVNGTPANELIRAIHPDAWVCTHSLGSKIIDDPRVAPIYAQAIILHEKADEHVILLANTRNVSVSVTVEHAMGGSMRTVDLAAGYQDVPYSETVLSSDALLLGGFAVAIVHMPPLNTRSPPWSILV